MNDRMTETEEFYELSLEEIEAVTGGDGFTCEIVAGCSGPPLRCEIRVECK